MRLVYSAALIAAAACKVDQPQAAGSSGIEYGYLVLSERAPEFGFKANDTLPEIARANVPRTVRDRGDSLVRLDGLPAGCNRYFGTGPYVLLVNRQCDIGTTETDTHWMTVIRNAKTPIRKSDLHFNSYRKWCPWVRDSLGNASEVCS